MLQRAAVCAVLANAILSATPRVEADPMDQPHVPIWSVGDQNHNSILKWDPAKDRDVPFNVSNVPLAKRIAVAENVNPHAKVGEGGVTVLTTFNKPTNDYSQGSATRQTFMPGYWHYIDKQVYWGGSATTGSILAPSAPVIDAGHRNGVVVLGNVFLPPVVYGGTIGELNAFLQKDAAGHFPVVDKMILAARTFHFDGYFVNQETAGGTAATATLMEEWLTYFKAQAPELEIQWYDAMDTTGKVGWKGALVPQNSPFFSTVTDGKAAPLSASMFLDFRWIYHPRSLDKSVKMAKELGRSPYELYSGVDFDANKYGIADGVNQIFGVDGDHLTSMGIFQPQCTYQRSPHDTWQPFYTADSVFWVGQNGDPSVTATGEAWKGIAHYVPAKSVIRGEIFATSFNKGAGTFYAINGAKLGMAEWNNLSLQDVEPTYQWIVRGAKTKLGVRFDHDDAFNGGTSLVFSGRLDAANDIRLFATELNVAADTKIKVVFKSDVDPQAKVAVKFANAPEHWEYVPIRVEKSVNGWQIATIDLGSHAGQVMAGLGLRIGEDGIKAQEYSLRLGELVVYRGSQSTPKVPTELACEKSEAMVAAAAKGDAVPLRLSWKASNDAVYTYDVYRRMADETKVFLGATPNTSYFVPDVKRDRTETALDLEVEAVGPDFGASATPATLSIQIPWPKKGA